MAAEGGYIMVNKNIFIAKVGNTIQNSNLKVWYEIVTKV